MKNQKHSIAYLKRQAKNLKNEQSISHSKALDLIAQKNGYMNWKHCLRSNNDGDVPNAKAQANTYQISFSDWLKRHKNRNSPLGDLASDMMDDKTWPSYSTLEEYVEYLEFKGAYYRAVETLKEAWKTYKRYLKRKRSPDTNKQRVSKPKPKNPDQRKITFIKGVTSLHFTKRTYEKFNPRDKAWISWDGSKAIPVTITEVDEHYYTFIVERPAKKAGNEHYLRLDEVRSTPELACINRVTS